MKFTVSGLRGIWGAELNHTVIEQYTHGFCNFLDTHSVSKIIICRDGRSTGEEIVSRVVSICIERGIDVLDLGIAPTPTCIFLVNYMSDCAGIIVTASHNPQEYNGLKFISYTGLFLNPDEIQEVSSLIPTTSKDYKKTPNKGVYTKEESYSSYHKNAILAYRNTLPLPSRPLRVVVDVINSAGYKIVPELIRQLGHTCFVINDDISGTFAHNPEPLPEHLDGLACAVKEHKADIGFALDPDADRLVLCDEKGSVVFEEYSLSLALMSVLSFHKGDIVTNISTSLTNEDIAQRFGVKHYRSRVGEAHVVSKMKEVNAVIGGEGSGGIIFPATNYCRDSLSGIMLILFLLEYTKKSVSELVSELSHYYFHKQKVFFDTSFETLSDTISSLFPEASISTLDGIRIDFPDRTWLQFRLSNTEPYMRIFGESRSKDEIDKYLSLISQHIPYLSQIRTL